MAPLSQAEREKMLKQCEEQRLEVGRTWDARLIVTLDLSERQRQPTVTAGYRVQPKIYMEVAVHVGLT